MRADEWVGNEQGAESTMARQPYAYGESQGGGRDEREMEEEAGMNPEESGPDAQEVTIPLGRIKLYGTLGMPLRPAGIVLFAHGSGSSRLSPRNRFVADVLQRGALAPLLFDLLTAEEERVDERTLHLRFDIRLLAERLVATTDWVVAHPELRELPIGYFGASTGAAAALVAAARRPNRVAAVVSRGGRPDLARSVLAQVRAPTLLIVGGRDTPVIGMNEDAMAQMLYARVQLTIVPGATHLCEERGALEKVAHLARDWFVRCLARAEIRTAPNHVLVNSSAREAAMPILRIKKFLATNGVAYETIEHPPAPTAQEVAAASHVSGKQIAKTVLVKLDGELAMVVLPASELVDLEHLERLTGKRVELAHEPEFRDRFPDCELGAMPPFGNLYGLEVYVGEDLAEDEWIAFNAGSSRELIRLRFRDFARLVRPKLLPLALRRS